MPREREAYRDNLECLNEFFPNENLLNVTELMRYTGKSRGVVLTYFQFRNGYISKVEVARQLSN